MRELENTIKRFVILRDENLIRAELQRGVSVAAFVSGPIVAPTIHSETDKHACADQLQELLRATLATEREVIQKALERSRWNRRKVAQELGVSYKTLQTKMKVCGLTISPAASPDS